MAVAKKRKNKKNPQKSNVARWWGAIVGVAVVGLIAFGAIDLFRQDEPLPAAQPASADDAASALTAAGREEFYLGPSTDAAALVRAETGATGHPTLVMFHADW